MTITSGPEQPSSRFLGSETDTLIRAGSRTRSTDGLILVGVLLLACGAPHLSACPSVHLAPDRQAILVTSSDRTTPSQLSLQSLPTESTLAPGLFVYTSSRMRDDTILGQLEGSIISLQEDADALANMRRDARHVDAAWMPKSDAVPPVGTAVQVEIRLITGRREISGNGQDLPAAASPPESPSLKAAY